jgi:hypothetical protein
MGAAQATGQAARTADARPRVCAVNAEAALLGLPAEQLPGSDATARRPEDRPTGTIFAPDTSVLTQTVLVDKGAWCRCRAASACRRAGYPPVAVADRSESCAGGQRDLVAELRPARVTGDGISTDRRAHPL